LKLTVILVPINPIMAVFYYDSNGLKKLAHF